MRNFHRRLCDIGNSCRRLSLIHAFGPHDRRFSGLLEENSECSQLRLFRRSTPIVVPLVWRYALTVKILDFFLFLNRPSEKQSSRVFYKSIKGNKIYLTIYFEIIY